MHLYAFPNARVLRILSLVTRTARTLQKLSPVACRTHMYGNGKKSSKTYTFVVRSRVGRRPGIRLSRMLRMNLLGALTVLPPGFTYMRAPGTSKMSTPTRELARLDYPFAYGNFFFPVSDGVVARQTHRYTYPTLGAIAYATKASGRVTNSHNKPDGGKSRSRNGMCLQMSAHPRSRYRQEMQMRYAVATACQTRGAPRRSPQNRGTPRRVTLFWVRF